MKTKDKDVFITIRASQSLGAGEKDDWELLTRGTYSYGKDEAVLSYMETELTGLEGTLTVFQVKPGAVVLSRRGPVTSKMVFQPGKCDDFLYGTQFGVLEMALDTHRLECALDEHGGSMEIEYDVDIERRIRSRNTFNIHVREREMNA